MGIKLEMVNGHVATRVPDPQKQGEPDLIDEHGTKQWRPDWSKGPRDSGVDAFLDAVTTVVLRVAKVSDIAEDIKHRLTLIQGAIP